MNSPFVAAATFVAGSAAFYFVAAISTSVDFTTDVAANVASTTAVSYTAAATASLLLLLPLFLRLPLLLRMLLLLLHSVAAFDTASLILLRIYLVSLM